VITAQGTKCSILARGAKGSNKRFTGRLDAFDHGSFDSAAGRGSIEVLRSFSPLHSYRKLRQSLSKLSCASLLCECHDLLILEHSEAHPEIFSSLTLALQAIDDAESVPEELRSCYLGLASLLHTTGFGHTTLPPSAKHLSSLIDQVERAAERQLASRTAIEELIGSLIKAKAANS
jgi:DNA repair protein RecO